MEQANKYNYVLMIATSYYKEALIDEMNKFHDVQCSIVIVVNGKDCDTVFRKYNQANFSRNCTIMLSPLSGKSNALNFYLETIPKSDSFIIFTDDDIIFSKETLQKYISAVEKHGHGYFYGGGVDVIIENEIPVNSISYYPDSIKGISEEMLVNKKQFLGCNWGAFASDLIRAGYFNPNFGPGSITNATGQERIMMNQLEKAGIYPFVIPNARVTHIAPNDCHTNQWLLNRIFRNNIKYGLQNPLKILLVIPFKFMKMLFSRDFGRKLTYFELMGMLRALKFNILLKINIEAKNTCT